MWRSILALSLLLASSASAWTDSYIAALGDSYSQEDGPGKHFAPYYQDEFRALGFNYSNYGANGSSTCMYVDPTFNNMTGLTDRRADLAAMVAAGPFFAVALQWSYNDSNYRNNGDIQSDAQAAISFDTCYRAIIDELANVSTYIFINTPTHLSWDDQVAKQASLTLFDAVVHQIAADYPKVYIGSKLFTDLDWEAHSDVDTIHPNAAGSAFYVDQLGNSIARAIHSNAGSYRDAER